MRQEIRSELAMYAEQQYRDFSSGLVPGAKPLLGVRLPQLRQLAKRIINDKKNKSGWRQETAACDGDWEDLFLITGLCATAFAIHLPLPTAIGMRSGRLCSRICILIRSLRFGRG